MIHFFDFLHYPAALEFCLRVILPPVFYIALKVQVFAFGEQLSKKLLWVRKDHRSGDPLVSLRHRSANMFRKI